MGQHLIVEQTKPIPVMTDGSNLKALTYNITVFPKALHQALNSPSFLPVLKGQFNFFINKRIKSYYGFAIFYFLHHKLFK